MAVEGDRIPRRAHRDEYRCSPRLVSRRDLAAPRARGSVDARRRSVTISPAWRPVASRRRFVGHDSYNQTGLVRTIELILGLPRMNQLDLSATLFRACFQDAPDPAPFAAVSNRVPLDEMIPPLSVLRGQARYWAEKSLALDLDD